MKTLLTSILLFISIASVTSQKIERIISLAPSLTKSIYYLEAADKLMGHTSFCHIAKSDNKKVVATAVKVNIEKVVSMRPDLVVATTITNPETIAMLRKAGLRVEVFSTPKSFDEICTQFVNLGTILGKDEKANAIVVDAKKQVAEIRAQKRSSEPLRFFIQIGAKPLYAVLENTFMNDYITFLGGKNIADGLTRGTLTREYVLVNKPDVIVVVTMGIVGDEEVKTWRSYAHLPAVSNNRVFIVESDMACTPTPPDFLKTLQILNELIAQTH